MAGSCHYRTYKLGDFQTNAYLIWDDEKTIVVDPGFDPSFLIRDILDLGRNSLQAIFLTHTHVDHIAGLARVHERFPCEVYVHTDEVSWLTSPEKNLSALLADPIRVDVPAQPVGEGPCPFWPQGYLYHTPGHSPGSLSLHLSGPGWLFGGDLLFRGSVGRTDFPGGDFSDLEESLRRLFRELPASTLVLPGHGPSTTLERERLSNAYVMNALAQEVS